MRSIVGLVAGLGVISSAHAGSPLGAFSSFQISWSGNAPVPTAVPTMSTYAIVLLAVLTFGLAASLVFVTDSTTAGLVFVLPPPVDAGSCNGTQTYTAEAPLNPPPCFINTCGAPVEVTYTFVSGQGPGGTPITADSCTLEYFCAIGEDLSASDDATDGASIPSDGLPKATAYCLEIFPPEEI
jgi:hypothetical protein